MPAPPYCFKFPSLTCAVPGASIPSKPSELFLSISSFLPSFREFHLLVHSLNVHHSKGGGSGARFLHLSYNLWFAGFTLAGSWNSEWSPDNYYASLKTQSNFSLFQKALQDCCVELINTVLSVPQYSLYTCYHPISSL